MPGAGTHHGRHNPPTRGTPGNTLSSTSPSSVCDVTSIFPDVRDVNTRGCVIYLDDVPNVSRRHFQNSLTPRRTLLQTELVQNLRIVLQRIVKSQKHDDPIENKSRYGYIYKKGDYGFDIQLRVHIKLR